MLELHNTRLPGRPPPARPPHRSTSERRVAITPVLLIARRKSPDPRISTERTERDEQKSVVQRSRLEATPFHECRRVCRGASY